MSILLVRHGETAWNAARIVQFPDTPLSDRGLAQARLLAARLESSGVAHILASDLARARMTAECLRETTGAELELEPLLHERNFGEHRGTPYSELGVDLFGPRYEPPGGESWELFHLRVDRAWQRAVELAARVEGDLAVVTHGLVCHSIVTRLVSLPEHIAAAAGVSPPGAEKGGSAEGGTLEPLRFGNTALTVLNGPDSWRVERLACTAHLDGDRADDASAPSGI